MNLKVVERIIPMLPAQLNYQKKFAERKRKAAVIKTEMNRIIVLNKRQTDRVQTDQIIGSNQEIVRRDVPRKITGLIKDLCKETGPNKVTDQTLRKDQIRGKDLLGTGRMRDQDQNKDRQVKIVRKVTGHKVTGLLKVTVHKGIVLHFVRAVVLDRKINQMKIGERIIAQKVKLSFLKATFNVSRNKYLADIVVCNSKSYSSFVNS
jgi:hypothetical protein